MIHFEKFSANHTLACNCPVISTPSVQAILPHTQLSWHLCQKAATINVPLHVSSSPLTNAFIPMPVTHCLDCCSFVANLEVLSLRLSCYLSPAHFFMNFRIRMSIAVERSRWKFHRENLRINLGMSAILTKSKSFPLNEHGMCFYLGLL